MKKFVVIFMTIAMLFSMVACGAHAASKDPVDLSSNSQQDYTNKQDLSTAPSVSDDEKKDEGDTDLSAPVNDVNSKDDTTSDVSDTAGSSSEGSTESNTTPAPSHEPEDEDTDPVVDTPVSTPDNSSSDVDTDDTEEPTPVHTHSWTDNGVAVVCPGCGMLEHGHAWDPIYTTEMVDDYEMQPHNYCSTCEMDVTDLLASGSSMKQHRQDTGCSGGGYYGEYVQVLVGSHEEQVVIGHKCSICGAEK